MSPVALSRFKSDHLLNVLRETPITYIVIIFTTFVILRRYGPEIFEDIGRQAGSWVSKAASTTTLCVIDRVQTDRLHLGSVAY